MEIISHRGYWKKSIEKNSEAAFLRSFAQGFGTETDVRDLSGQLVIAHDPACSDDMLLDDFLKIYSQHGRGLTLAINIKADGLQQQLLALLGDNGVKNYFVFDMSIPDTLLYAKAGIPYFSRMSEYEQQPVLVDGAEGVWLDAFEGNWYDMDAVTLYLDRHKKVCIVSPELHGRCYRTLWSCLKSEGLYKNDRLILCTDLPEVARNFFR